MGMYILLYYRLRFQQELIFRDAKQHVGLNDCQARSKEQIDFHVNMENILLTGQKNSTRTTQSPQSDTQSRANRIKRVFTMCFCRLKRIRSKYEHDYSEYR